MKKIGVFFLILTIGGFISFLSFWYTLRFEVKGETVKTPNIIGKTIDEAVRILKKENLLLEINLKRKVYSDYIEKGNIAIQIPEPGKIIKKGRKIEVILSKGSRRDVVPDVVGMTVEEASKKMNFHGLKVSKIASVYSDKPEGIIIAQSPEGGLSGVFNDKVKLLVSKGKRPARFEVPDFRYLPLVEVERFLKRYRIQYVVKTFANQIRDKHILFVKEQYPMPGYKLNSDETITLKVVMRENL